MWSIGWRTIGLTIASCVLATSCASTVAPEIGAGEHSAEAERQQLVEDASRVPDAPPVLLEWINQDLPTPFSPLTATAGVVVYRSVIDQKLNLVAVSAASGDELWRREINPLGQLRGTAPAPLIAEGSGVVVAPQYSFFGSRATGFDLFTGEELWSESTIPDAVGRFQCGDDVCAQFEDSRDRYNVLTGEHTSESVASEVDTIMDLTTEVVFGAGPRPNGRNANWFGLVDSASGAERWRVERLDIEKMSGVSVDPSLGWSARIDEDGNRVVMFLGSDEPATMGVWSGLDFATGELLWTHSDGEPCIFDDYAPDEILLCGSSADGRSILRLSFEDGETMWSNVVASPDEYVWASAVGEFVFVDGPEGSFRFDLESGALVEASPVELCGFTDGWQDLDVEWFDEPLSYRSATHAALCDSDFESVSAADAVELDPELATSAHVTAGNGWSVTVGMNGELSGVYTG